MPSDTGDEGGTPPLPKSKQERIRDNQRRSRARRQEYLAELERRLAECQLACREADIQRAAFLEMQVENTRLRELLAMADVNEQFIQQYVSQAVANSRQYHQDSNTALRQIKPKMPSPDSQSQQTQVGQTSVHGRMPPRMSQMAIPTTSTDSSISMTDSTIGAPMQSTYMTSPSFTTTQSTPVDHTAGYNWHYAQNQHTIPSVPSQTAQPFRCITFGIQMNQPSRIAGEDSIPCSVAKQMLDQHQLSNMEWQQVKAKLLPGFCRPPRQSGNCGIDNHVLFQVLQQLGQRYS